ncbi:cysteinyl-tRNA synthetase, partial [Thraustotheca clavata]
MNIVTRIRSRYIRVHRGWNSLHSKASSRILAMNSLSGTLDPLPQSSEPLKWYVCGPTVYDSAHLGHARTYVSQDILRRILTNYFRQDINMVMGMTDVDDKIIATAQRLKKSMTEVAGAHEDAFLKDLAALNVLRASSITRVSEHIPEIIQYIETLKQNGFAYATSDGMYFDTVALGSEYGKLAPNAATIEDNEVVEEGIGSEKRNARDFALWKRSKTEDEPGWESPFGRGRPGWHIECSAMTHHVLGGSIDVHSGGIDLCFPHHNNEVAQCDGYHHKTPGHVWCKHFIHFGHLYIKGLKMSKSLKNFISIEEFLKEPSASSDAFRLFCLQYKYNTNVHFSLDRMRDANVLLQRFVSFFQTVLTMTKAGNTSRRLESADDIILVSLYQTKVKIDQALRNDFDTPEVLLQLTNLMSLVNREIKVRHIPIEAVCQVATFVLEMCQLLGLKDSISGFASISLAASTAPEQASDLQNATAILDAFTALRAQVRQVALTNTKDPQFQSILQLCDRIRDQTLPPMGIQIDDVSSGQSHWKLQPYQKPETLSNNSSNVDPVKAQLAAKQAEFEAEMQIPPENYFQESKQFKGKFTEFDQDGIPLTDENGQIWTKSGRKKLLKKLEKHIKSYENVYGTLRVAMSSVWTKLKGFDANPKTLEEFKVRTMQGGLFSLVAFALMFFLFISELQYYLTVDTVDKMYVDGQRNVNLSINFDIEFPRMPCQIVSIEHADLAGRVQLDVIDNIHKVRLDYNGNPIGEKMKESIGGALKNESELINQAPLQKLLYMDGCGNCYGAGEPGECCNTCEDVKNAYIRKNWALPSLHNVVQCMNAELESILKGQVREGCRISGHLDVAKVEGRFYFAPSKIFQSGYLVADDVLDSTFKVFDNSHTIHTLTFGKEYPNMKNPLNDRFKHLGLGKRGAFQYFLKVVSTDYTFLNGQEINSNQYSVTEHFLEMTPTGQKGLPRVTFAYEFSPIKFRIEQTQKGFTQFLTSFCAIVGGVFTVMGLVDSAMYNLMAIKRKSPLL